MVVEKKTPLFLSSRLFQDVVSELKARAGGLRLVKVENHSPYSIHPTESAE